MRAGGHLSLSSIGLILGSVLCFSILDTVVKILAARYPIALIVWARYGVQAIVMLLWLGPRMRFDLLRAQQPWLQIVRAIVVLLSSVCFFTALKNLPLAEATALNYSSPVIVVVLAAVFLHERMTRLRIAFVLSGIAGMLLIVRPGTAIFQNAALFAIAAACLYATFQILTRKVARDDPRVTLFYPAAIGTVLTTLLAPSLGMPDSIPPGDIILLVAIGILGTFGHLLFILAFQRGPVSALIPFTYMQLVFATLIGWGMFGNFPDIWTLAGMVVIAGSGLLITLQERRRLRPAVPKPPAADPAAVE